MYARSSTFHGRPENIDEGLRFVETEARPTLDQIDGCRGLSVLVNRDSGDCIATSSWDSEDAMRASDDALRPIRERGREIFGGSMQVDEWEVVLMHREHPTAEGACCRVTWAQVEPAKADGAAAVVRDQALGALEQVPGFCSMSMLLDRSAGIACVTATYDSREAMESSRAQVDQIRTGAAQAGAMTIIEVREYELALAHLRVPELV